MQHAILDFLSTALVPELRADVSAGTACNVELFLIAIAAVRALPHELAVVFHNLNLTVEAAHLAIIALRIELLRT